MSDCISRDAAMEIVKRTSGDYAAAFSEIRKLPAADVEPVRRGEWRLVRRMAAFGEYKCSVCGRIETFGYFNKQENNPYCHCGAKMELEDEDNDD